MLDIENFDRKFEHIIHSHQWKEQQTKNIKSEIKISR